MRIFAIALLCFLAACGASNLPSRSVDTPFVKAKGGPSQASKMVVFVPGALNSIGLFRKALEWQKQGYELIFYRFPGYDGLSADHRLDIEDAGLEIAEFVDDHGADHVRLLGYSTGGPIALEAAKHIVKPDLKVAAMSSAVPFPTSISTAVRGVDNFGRVVSKLGTFDKDRIWKQYYQVLLFGEAGLEKPKLQDVIKKTTERELKNVTVPPGDLISKHTGDLRFWSLKQEQELAGKDIRFYHGLEDPVFSTTQTLKLAEQIPQAEIMGYAGQGHLLFLTAPRVFDDILDWFEQP